MNQLHLFEDPEAHSFKNFTIYRSSAGSGKTFTLVKEYLKIVLRNPQDYQHILAITFTNKATEEMKGRILNELWDLASGHDTDMRRNIQQEFKHFEQPLNIPDRAKKALTNILHNYSRFSISTIDHFFSQLVRALARELKLSLNYEIDVDDDTAMEESVQLLYDSLTDNPDLQSWTKDFAFSRIEQDKGWQLDYTLIEFGKELFKEKFHRGFSKLEKDGINIKSLRDLEGYLQDTQKAYLNQMKDYARKAKKLIAQHGLRKDDFKGKSKGAANTFDKILRNDVKLTLTFQKTARGEDDWYSGTSLKREEIKAVVAAGLGQIASDIYQYHQAHYSEYMTAHQLQQHIYSYGLLDAISEKLKIYRQTNNLMLLSHNSFLLREIISDREAPFLFEKLGSYYHHVLIDEFQDTSTYQWENLKPLITNALDQYNHVLLVGDAKQAIYRWRGGDLNLLLRKAIEDLSLYRQQLQEETLQQNRRSARSVVNFNNQFFEIAHQLLLHTDGLPHDSSMLTEVYKEVEQESKSPLEGGVQINFFDHENNQWRQQSLEAVTVVVKEHIKNGGSYNDFLILSYKNSEVAEISEHLSLLGMPVDSEQALNLSGNWAVRLLISSMRLLVDPQDKLARAEMTYLYQKGIGADVDFNQIFKQAVEIDSGLLDIFLPDDLINQWVELSHLNIYEWVSVVIPLLIPTRQPGPFLNRFLEICLEQSAKGIVTAYDFLDWWEEKKEQQMVIFPSHQQAVRVMTIHKAKGLEAPVVIIPWADFELKPRQNTVYWTDQLQGSYKKYKLLPLSFTSDLLDSHFSQSYQQELLEGLIEGLNTLYVAFTRARQQLYVFSSKPSSTKLDDLGVAHKLLWEVCNQPQWGGCWNLTRFSFTMGDLSESVVSAKGEAQPTVPIEKLRITPYKDRTNIRSGHHRMFTLLDHYKSKPIREGVQVHAVLERLNNKKDLSAVIDQLQAEGSINVDEKRNIREKVSALFQLPGFGLFFDPKWKVFSEREIASGGKWYKPDRVLVSSDHTIVVDFKREKENQEHHRQVNAYVSLLESMGYRNIEKYLVYVSDPRIIQL